MTFRAKLKIRFLADYRGSYTRNTFYRAGSEIELQEGYAAWLLDNGWAVLAGVEVTQAAIDLALANSIPLAKIKGTGAGGRILVKDVEAQIDNN